MKITATKDMEDMKMTKAGKFEIDTNKLNKVVGGKDVNEAVAGIDVSQFHWVRCGQCGHSYIWGTSHTCY